MIPFIEEPATPYHTPLTCCVFKINFNINSYLCLGLKSGPLLSLSRHIPLMLATPGGRPQHGHLL
jgi:hypothetical protein